SGATGVALATRGAVAAARPALVVAPAPLGLETPRAAFVADDDVVVGGLDALGVSVVAGEVAVGVLVAAVALVSGGVAAVAAGAGEGVVVFGGGAEVGGALLAGAVDVASVAVEGTATVAGRRNAMKARMPPTTTRAATRRAAVAI